MKLFKNSGTGVDPDNFELVKTITIWVGVIMFLIIFLFFNVIWQYL
jgi:hypothetical protein